ncbi:glycoside hydrolase family protein [Pseudomonas anguilliseptica]|uniref:glycoside hydrolase family protein n=1 Tax=Pseudomonas anguilliseptica TaxID=53406 RepID=UPI0022AE6477|nr:glycoside hydrolase family protein [Pseudomonas anguilliseptica]MCZ4321451.1 glycoside hydrolase family protein [Pseudomonas anguilliseptica]
MSIRNRVLAVALSLSAAGFAAWQASEGESPAVKQGDVELLAPHIPTKGDVPTIGHGSTRYEDGTPVTLADKPITRERAGQLARSLHEEEEQRFRASLPGVKLFQEEYDLYVDFTGQYGIGNWRASSMRRELLAGNYTKACNALLRYRYAAKYDCSTTINGKPNRRCWGVWERQLKRHAQCMAVQP